MARLNSLIQSEDDGLPDLADLLQSVKHDSEVAPQKRPGSTTSSTSPAKTAAQNRRQRPLKIAHVNSLLLPLTEKSSCRLDYAQDTGRPKPKIGDWPTHSPSPKKSKGGQENGIGKDDQLRSSPRKAAKRPVDYSAITLSQEEDPETNFGSLSEDHLSDFIVDDSDSDSEAAPVWPPSKSPTRSQKRNGSSQKPFRPPDLFPIIDLSSPEKAIRESTLPQTPPKDPLDVSPGDEHLGRLEL